MLGLTAAAVVERERSKGEKEEEEREGESIGLLKIYSYYESTNA